MLIFVEGVNVILVEVPIGTCQAVSCSPTKTKRNENQNAITSNNRFLSGTDERSSPWKMESRKWILKSKAKRSTPIALELGHHWASKQVSEKNFMGDKSTLKQQNSRTGNLVIISALSLEFDIAINSKSTCTSFVGGTFQTHLAKRVREWFHFYILSQNPQRNFRQR